MRTQTIPSYLFTQYSDDVDLQAFVDAYNTISQSYLDWFNSINLPIYTGLTGSLLDWVGLGVYGVQRPTLQNGSIGYKGPLNTFAFNGGVPFNGLTKPVANGSVVSDDVYQRVLTWLFYKGDGQVFNINWLKRRILRFLFGSKGQDVKIESNYGISVTIAGTVITINMQTGAFLSSWINSLGQITYGESNPAYWLYDSNGELLLDVNGIPLSSYSGGASADTVILANILKSAIQSGVCPLPFQFTYIINVT